jgi:hypothetical protein
MARLRVREPRHRAESELAESGTAPTRVRAGEYFPLEPHFLFPGFQFLPAWLRVRVGQLWPYSWLKHYGAAAAEIEQEARTIRLPSSAELRRFFPDAQLRAERVYGWTKSLIAYRPFQVEKR